MELLGLLIALLGASWVGLLSFVVFVVLQFQLKGGYLALTLAVGTLGVGTALGFFELGKLIQGHVEPGPMQHGFACGFLFLAGGLLGILFGPKFGPNSGKKH